MEAAGGPIAPLLSAYSTVLPSSDTSRLGGTVLGVLRTSFPSDQPLCSAVAII